MTNPWPSCWRALATSLVSTWIALFLLAACHRSAFGEYWDIVYDGMGSAADNVPNYLRWDSAIDDDWDEPPSTFRLDTPSAGFMSVDRATNAIDHIKTGNIWIRDPIFNHAAGFTMEVGVRLLPNSNSNAFSMTYLDNGSSFGVHLSPNQIKAGNLASGGSGVTTPFDTTNAFHNYRIVKLPNSHTIRVYVDDNPTPVITGAGDSAYVTGSRYLKYPRILIGDNENNTIYNANYVLDYVRFRRGATAPGETPPEFPARVLPPLPPPAPLPGAATTPVWQSTFDSTADGVNDIFNGNSGKTMIGPAANGRLQITSWDNTTNAFSPDKAGRSLGMTLGGDDSMSAQYKFNWSTLNSNTTPAYEAVGFLGQSTSPQTRQILGSLLRHWKSGNDYFVAVDAAAGSVGNTNFGYVSGSPINLGPNALLNDYEFRVHYNGTTHRLGLDLMNAMGTRLGGQSVDLDTDVPGLLNGNTAQEIGAFALTHVGWSDYTGSFGNRATVWKVDSLTFDDTATGAFQTGAEVGEVWMAGYDGVGQPMSLGWIQGGGNTFLQQPNGIMEFNSLASAGNARLDAFPTWADQGGITIEARLKVMPDSEEQGFNLAAMDSLGDTSLVLSPDKVQLMHFSVPVGAATVEMDTTDDFHVYRLTRRAGDLYWHLYVDDNPVAAIEYQHAGGTQLGFNRIWFGDIAYPIPDNGGHVLIDYIRWHEGANAPAPLPLLGDYDRDQDVDANDYDVWQQSFGSTSDLDADGNGNGVVDSADYVLWRNQLGAIGTRASLDANQDSDAQQALVPEPTSSMTIVIGTLIIWARRIKRISCCPATNRCAGVERSYR
jgi:hypothetical protein